jgi:ATP-dependent Clp protease adaptor protein ClpS
MLEEGLLSPIAGNGILPDVQEVIQEDTMVVHVPLYHVVLLDDDDHTYDYVIEMLGAVFGHSIERAYQMACEVDANGRVIVDTTHLDRAELKRDQIHGFGADWRMPHCKGSMGAVIEPAT